MYVVDLVYAMFIFFPQQFCFSSPSEDFLLSLLRSVNIVIIDRKLFWSIPTFTVEKHHCPNNTNSFWSYICVEIVLEFLLIQFTFIHNFCIAFFCYLFRSLFSCQCKLFTKFVQNRNWWTTMVITNSFAYWYANHVVKACKIRIDINLT